MSAPVKGVFEPIPTWPPEEKRNEKKEGCCASTGTFFGRFVENIPQGFLTTVGMMNVGASAYLLTAGSTSLVVFPILSAGAAFYSSWKIGQLNQVAELSEQEIALERENQELKDAISKLQQHLTNADGLASYLNKQIDLLYDKNKEHEQQLLNDVNKLEALGKVYQGIVLDLKGINTTYGQFHASVQNALEALETISKSHVAASEITVKVNRIIGDIKSMDLAMEEKSAELKVKLPLWEEMEHNLEVMLLKMASIDAKGSKERIDAYNTLLTELKKLQADYGNNVKALQEMLNSPDVEKLLQDAAKKVEIKERKSA